jgi:hypothetical protein
MSRSKESGGGGGGLEPSGIERVRAQLARVRARFGIDPAIPSPLLAGAWSFPDGAVEEDVAEFADALVDCLSAGMPLDAAVASWASGALARDDQDDQEVGDDELGAMI